MNREQLFGSSVRGLLHNYGADLVNGSAHELRRIVVLSEWQRDDCCERLVARGSLGWVLSGTIRKYLVSANGQRHIVDVLMPGDFFGLRIDEAERFSLQAIADETVTAHCQRGTMEALASADPQVDQLLRECAYNAIARLENHVLAQGRTTAVKKVAAYLLTLSARLPDGEGAMTLPLSRYDIADHLGIAVETVSRAISELRNGGLIALDRPRHLAIVDRRRLSNDL